MPITDPAGAVEEMLARLVELRQLLDTDAPGVK